MIEIRIADDAAGTDRCPMCRDIGWVLEDPTGLKPSVLELLPCLLPNCACSGQQIELLSVNQAFFKRAVTLPDGQVMAVEA